MVEGARLERVYRGNSIEGSNPSLSAIISHYRFKYPSCGWLRISLVPRVDGIVLLVFYCLKCMEGPNSCGGGPTTAQIAETFQ